MMRVLVCGGRDYADAERLSEVLHRLHDKAGIDVIVQGGAKGADHWAKRWGELCGVPVETYEADWLTYGKAAGPIRNAQMLAESRPDVVIAFPTPGAKNKGTKSMMRIAREAGVEVVEIAT